MVRLRILRIDAKRPRLVGQRLVVDLRMLKRGEQPARHHHVIEHFAAPQMQERIARRLGDVVLARDHHARTVRRIAGLLDRAADRLDRHFAGVGVEVARDRDQCIGAVRVEQLVDQQPRLQRLSQPFHRRDEAAFGPRRDRLPGVIVDALPRNAAGELRFHVHVDDVQRAPAADVVRRVEHRPLPLDRLRGRVRRNRGGHLIGGARS